MLQYNIYSSFAAIQYIQLLCYNAIYTAPILQYNIYCSYATIQYIQLLYCNTIYKAPMVQCNIYSCHVAIQYIKLLCCNTIYEAPMLQYNTYKLYSSYATIQYMQLFCYANITLDMQNLLQQVHSFFDIFQLVISHPFIQPGLNRFDILFYSTIGSSCNLKVQKLYNRKY